MQAAETKPTSEVTEAEVTINVQVPEWRSALYDELHARPFPVVSTPIRVTHIAMQSVELEHSREREIEHLSDLCRRYSVPPPAADASCYFQKFGEFELRWERHTEFSTYTFLRPGCESTPFHKTAVSLLPKDWLGKLPGRVVVALHMTVQDMPDQVPEPAQLHDSFEGQRLIGSELYDGKAMVWTGFRLHSDGFGRMLIYQNGLNKCETGRLIQRLLEIETYRLMALLALPIARQFGPELYVLDKKVAKANEQIAQLAEHDHERELLNTLSSYAAEIEQMRAKTNYRFGATRAYAEIIEKRLLELHEAPLAGIQTMGGFLDRRFMPALRTCDSVAERFEQLAARIDRATDLIRTRVDLTIEEQNQDLLTSMNRRSSMQLRLQQAVEGLSVVAISFYLVELVKRASEGLGYFDIMVDPKLITAVSVPLLLLSVFVTVRWFRRRLDKS